MIFIQIIILTLSGLYAIQKMPWYSAFVFLAIYGIYVFACIRTNFVTKKSKQEPVLKRILFRCVIKKAPLQNLDPNDENEEPIYHYNPDENPLDNVYRKRAAPQFIPKTFKEEMVNSLYWSITDARILLDKMYFF